MTAQELRVGNKLNDTHGRTLTVNEIKNNCVGCHYEGQQNTTIEGIRYSSFPYEDLRPIPLTPELLERCANNKTCDSGYRIAISEDMGQSIFIYKTLAGWAVELFSFGTSKPLPVMHHLHQLQNLFFALTGEELNVKM